ncbi:MAG: hypothetical protein K0R90_476 [Oscillospiraceae bacterium]|jgi:N-glycosylase/DNA lyase|nr:hypothetical protein [Oscillospiraceae bacterium]
MKVNTNGRDIEVTIDGFCLEDTLDCGQSFRWEKNKDGSFSGVAYSRVLTISQHGNKLIFKNTSSDEFETLWKVYFDLETDYSHIKSFLCSDKTIKSACSYAGGIRILRQDSWEALCCFIISQNNNIPRIKGIVSRLCENFGKELESGIFSFPDPQDIFDGGIEALDVLRAGFRAGYLYDAARKVLNGEVNLEEIKTMPIEDARTTLMKIKGVGPKVAECALLYGFYRVEAFPVDVWIKRALHYFYADGFPKEYESVGGIAQQYIFHYIRTCEDAIPDEYKKQVRQKKAPPKVPQR